MPELVPSVPNVELLVKVNATAISGWTGIRITRSMESLAHTFQLELTNQRVDALGGVSSTGVSRSQVKAAADVVEEDDKVRVRINGEIVISGYVDETNLEYDAHTARYTVTGTSKTGDLVDSSAIYKTGVWRDAAIYEIAADLCEPFGIKVYQVGPLGENFKRFRLEPGEKVYEAISRGAAMRGYIPLTDPEGDMALLRASKASTGAVLELGSNILSCSISRSRRERFSTYYFKGQTAASDDWNGKQASQLKNEVDDPEVKRYRPLVVLSAKQKTKEDLGKRAIWERNVRAGRSLRLQYTVEGWHDNTGKLWTPNTRARAKDDWAGLDAELLITSVEQVLDQEYTTTLELMDPRAFEPEPAVPNKFAR